VSRFHVAADAASIGALRDQVEALLGLLRQPQVDLTALGHGLHRVAVSMLAASEAAGLTSARLQAAVRALDLKTPKSKLLAFLAP
jgi:hypothetical protein